MNILITAVGRRPYLVEWFQEALQVSGGGTVIAADVDANAPVRAFADEFLVAPRADSDEYEQWLRQTLEEEDIQLAVSINDFELSTWSRLPAGSPWEPLVRLDESTQNMVEDKVEMNRTLEQAGVETPKTWVGSQLELATEEYFGNFVTKGRFGSGSRGLRFPTAQGLADTVSEVLSEVTDRNGRSAQQQGEFPAEDLVLVQEKIEGMEYGLDIVCDLEGNYAGVLAREKLAMRAGETDRAMAVDAQPFTDLAKQLAKAVPHPGTMDVDVIVTEGGQMFVIDINPRFGGGYPLSHVAGADVPAAYIAWGNSDQPPVGWDQVQQGTLAGKFVGVARL